ncbi:peptidogalycan biosysnthesis protein [Streptomyces sp. NEAU-174]|uniref:peptidogalycan biosysnthesis protein n=1 Tax=Streptomyces sp. NEAU-174 TaxID=3458254 RepID=UPI004043B855
METIISHDIDDIDPPRWDALVRGVFYSGHAWARYQQYDVNSSARYIQVIDSGRLVAAAAVYLVHKELSFRYQPDVIFPEAHQGRLSGSPTLIVGNRRGNSNSLLLDRAHPRAETALRSLLDTVNGIASNESDGRAWWLYLNDEDTRQLMQRTETLFPKILAGDCTIELPGVDFDDYLSSLSSSQRRQVKSDRRTFNAVGYTTASIPFSRSWETFSPLVASHERSHGHDVSDEFIAQLMKGQAAACGDTGTVHACWKESKMVAGGLTFSTASMMAGRAFGFDHSQRSSSEYFELFYYRPLEMAYRENLDCLHLGIGTLQAKARRGAIIRPLWGLATGEVTSQPSKAAREHNQRTWDEFKVEVPGNPHALRSELMAEISS